ncbi:hypothetical protein QYM36_012240 [Artemia franciscana]|uniref:SH3 domain-containing protein n=1 Tax=Artemia franciscana TaxID=6661 RepID=A0AA88HTY6_ARTSF|nr:hypothetical protein QYM36_012240 [Artemia franciscana]
MKVLYYMNFSGFWPLSRYAAIRFEDVIETSVPRASCLQIRLKSGVKLSLYSHRATLIRDLIERFAVEADTNSQTFVRALSDCNTKEPGVLSFRKGDLIRVANPADSYLEKGYLYGMLNGKAGIFPMEYVEFVDVESVHAYESGTVVPDIAASFG